MVRSAFTGVNSTRAAVSRALRDAHGDWSAALRPLATYLRAGIAARGWGFVADTAQDLDAGVSPTLRAITMRALEVTDDPTAALRLVRRLTDRRDNPELAARVWREAKSQLCGAVWRALRAQDQARRPRACPQQLTFQWPQPAPKSTTT